MKKNYSNYQMENLYNWVFHYNAFTKLWAAIPRDKYDDYWSVHNLPGVLRSKSHATLVELIIKTQGDEAKLDKLVGKK